MNSSPRTKPRLTGREIIQPTLIMLSLDDQGSRSYVLDDMILNKQNNHKWSHLPQKFIYLSRFHHERHNFTAAAAAANLPPISPTLHDATKARAPTFPHGFPRARERDGETDRRTAVLAANRRWLRDVIRRRRQRSLRRSATDGGGGGVCRFGRPTNMD